MTDEEFFLGNAPSRVLRSGIFPSSPRASRREGIFSDILSDILGTDPAFDLADLETHIKETSDVPIAGGDREEILDVLDAKYVTEPRDNQSGNNRALIPFHRVVAQHIEPPESNPWGRWYGMLMTDKGQSIDKSLHEDLVEELRSINPSNAFEALFVDEITSMSNGEATAGMTSPTARRCYLPELATRFRTDIRSWVALPSATGSQRLFTLRDLICFYLMMYQMQLARNIGEEWDQFVSESESSVWSPSLSRIPFGIRTEAASNHRDFRNVWDGSPTVPSLFDDLYGSWMPLAVLRILNDTIEELSINTEPLPLRLLEARDVLAETTEREQRAVKNLTDPIHPSQYDSSESLSLREAARLLAETIDTYYRMRDDADTAAVRIGPGAVEQLGISQDRGFIERRQRAGLILVLNEGALIMLARLFTQRERDGSENYTFNNFRNFLEDRGIWLKGQSQAAARNVLEGMGLIRQESDSGDSINVRTH